MDYYNIVNEIVTNFIHKEGYEEEEIEKKIKNLINQEIQDISEISVYYSPSLDSNKIKIRVYLKIKNIHDRIKCNLEFENEFLLNSKRKIRLKKMLE